MILLQYRTMKKLFFLLACLIAVSCYGQKLKNPRILDLSSDTNIDSLVVYKSNNRLAVAKFSDLLDKINQQTGNGDMLKSVYDLNNNGVVEAADLAYSIQWANILNKPINLSYFTNDLDFQTLAQVQTLLTANSTADQQYTITEVATKEDALGNPSSDGQILSSETDGTRVWIDPPSGGSSVPVVDALNSTATDEALSANQGRNLNLALQNKQDQLVSGTNIKTINGQNILTPGDINIDGTTNLNYVPGSRTLESSTGNNVILPEVVAGGNSGLMTGTDKQRLDDAVISDTSAAPGSDAVTNAVSLTKAELDAIPVKDPNTIYYCTDCDPVDAGGGSNFTVDSALNPASANPVENQVVTAALNAKKDDFTENTGFNKDFGTTANTVKEGDWLPGWEDVQGKPSAFPPSGHTHSAVDVVAGVLSQAVIPNLSANKITNGILDFARLPVGTANNQVAVGNHNHDAVYLGINATANNSNNLGGVPASNYITTGRMVSSGNGLGGGGSLASNITINLLNLAAGSNTQGAVWYNGTTRSAGRFYGGTTTPTSSNRLNYDGHFFSNTLNASNVTSTTIVANGTTASIDKDSGALIVGGGAGINGDVNAGGDVKGFQSSDIRLKNNIYPISNPLSKLQKLNGVTFNWDETKQHLYKGKDVGVIAQQVQAVFPSLVRKSTVTNKLQVDYSKLVALLIEVNKEQQKQIENLTKRVEKLEKDN